MIFGGGGGGILKISTEIGFSFEDSDTSQMYFSFVNFVKGSDFQLEVSTIHLEKKKKIFCYQVKGYNIKS